MKILEYKEINPITSRMKLLVEAEELKTAFDKVLEDLGKETEVPGFRPGKAPDHLVERHIGTSEIWRMASDKATGKAFEEALKEKCSSCIKVPDFKHDDYEGHGDYEVEIIYHPEPPSPQELMQNAKKDLVDIKGPDDHIPKELRRDADADHRNLRTKGPTGELNIGKVEKRSQKRNP